MDKKILVVLLTMVVAISACPQSSIDFNPNAGIVTQDLSFDIPKVYDDETTSLMFDMVNVGGKKIETGDSIQIYVYGPTIGPKGGHEDVWKLESSQPNTVTPANGYITDSISGTELPPPDPSLGTPGGRRSFEFELTPAKVLDGMEIPTMFYVSLCYPYNTETLTQVEVTSKNELRATGFSGSRKDTVNAGGPIHIILQGGTGIRPGSSIPLVFKINDVDGGYPSLKTEACTVDLEKNKRDRVTITVTVDGFGSDKVDCGGSGTSKNSNEVRLRKETGALFCKFTPGSTSDAPRHTYMVKAKAEYKYYTISTATVTNIGSSLS